MRAEETELRHLLTLADMILYFPANSSFSKLLLSIRRPPSPVLHSSRVKRQLGRACVEEPPCFPPIPSSNEDQRRGYQALNQPPVHFTCVSMNLRSCAEPRRLRGIVLSGLISIPQRMRTMEPAWAIRR